MTSWLETHRLALVLVLLAVIAVGAVVWLQKLDDRRPLVIKATTPTPIPGGARVFVSGAVRQPGVYQFAPGDRVEQALALAGGPADDADLRSINLASRLRDEQRVQVPRLGEVASPVPGLTPARTASVLPTAGSTAGSIAGSPGLVDLNTATIAELDTLPGIGTVTAGKIVAAREASGGFRDVADLRSTRLVNASTFDKIKDRVTIGDAVPTLVSTSTPLAGPSRR